MTRLDALYFLIVQTVVSSLWLSMVCETELVRTSVPFVHNKQPPFLCGVYICIGCLSSIFFNFIFLPHMNKTIVLVT